METVLCGGHVLRRQTGSGCNGMRGREKWAGSSRLQEVEVMGLGDRVEDVGVKR